MAFQNWNPCGTPQTRSRCRGMAERVALCRGRGVLMNRYCSRTVASCAPCEAINWLAKEVPKSEHTMERRFRPQRITLRGRAEHGAPMIFAQMGMMQAIHRHRERVFHPDRKEHHWARRKLSRDR